MYAVAFVAALAASSLVSAAPLNEKRGQPAGWATGYLEDYNTYHLRYLALDCQDQHNTSFFEDCCHPLLATEQLSSRPSYCTPNATEIASASSQIAADAAATATSTSDDSSDEYCDATSSAASSTVKATATSANTKASSSAAAPTNNVEQYAQPASTKATKTSTSTAAAKTTASSSSGGGQVETGGYATYFYQNGNAGACGTVHSDYDMIIAIDAAGWWPNYETSDSSQYCGKWITITNTQNGNTVTAQVADVCPTCDTNNSLDLSVGAFEALASLSEGQIPITWVWA